MKKEETKKQVLISPLNIEVIQVPIIGKTPLLMDRMPEKVKKGILDKQTGVAKGKKELRDTKEETKLAIHRTSKGSIGFPAAGFKKGMMEVTSYIGDRMFSRKLVSGAVRIINQEDGLIPIKFKKQDILEHNISHNTKFTPQFHKWSCTLAVQYDANTISASDIVTLVNYAGFYIGIGAWRPKGKDGGSGEYGMYEVNKNGKKV